MLTVENIETIRHQFQLLKSKDDLLALLNYIAYPQLYKAGYIPDDIDLSKVNLREEGTTAENLNVIFGSSQKKKKKTNYSKTTELFFEFICRFREETEALLPILHFKKVG